MIDFQLFPRSNGLSEALQSLVDEFASVEKEISSGDNNLNSNEVLAVLRPGFEKLNYQVESGKRQVDKIHVPVLYGLNNSIDKHYFADALSSDGKIVVEVEAGRATENNQYLKDIFQACLMHNVEYLVLAVRKSYRGHNDFEKIYAFLETVYISNRIILPLKGVLLIGY